MAEIVAVRCPISTVNRLADDLDQHHLMTWPGLMERATKRSPVSAAEEPAMAAKTAGQLAVE